MEIAPAHHLGSDAIGACLLATAKRDPLVVPVDPAEVLAREAFAAVLDGRVVGVAWSRPAGLAREVEARVLPGARRKGVGSALLRELTGHDDELLCSCDAGHPGARRFVERRGFSLMGVQFFQRWDGTVDDVPRTFQSCTLNEPEDTPAAIGRMIEAHGEVWPPPMLRADDLLPEGTRIREARIDGEVAGVLVAWPGDDVWTVGGIAVMPTYRSRGVGRALCCDLMRRAAAEGRGVVLRVHHADERQQAWTAALGFWTYRSWACYRRGPRA